MTEPEAKLQATANLSPVSPSPLHTAAPRVVPALQETVDTINAMVAAAAAANAAQSTDLVDGIVLDPAMADGVASANGTDHVVDDDSLDGAYDDQDAAVAPAKPAAQLQQEPLDSNDDYAKTFDSPIDPEEGGERGFQQHHVPSSMPTKSNDISFQVNALKSSHASDPELVAHGVSTAHQLAHDAIQTGAQPEIAVPPAGTWQSPGGPQPRTVLPSSAAEPEPAADQDIADAESRGSSVEIQKLVADLTAQPNGPSPDAEQSSSSVAARPDLSTDSASLSSPTSLPSSSSLPPRPPLPQPGSQSYPSQQSATGVNPNAPAPGASAVLSVSGPSPSFVVGSTPGTPMEAVSSLPLPPDAGSNALPVAAPMNVPVQASQAASGVSQDGEPNANYQRQWDRFMTDERQYMSDAKWDRFPEGSRIFIGNLSSDKVSKRDVFDVFNKYGRLAQISLKSAYGFVQYHTVDEGNQAMANLQGTEIKGRRIHLEISRVQDKAKKDRARTPERGRGRDGGGRRNDKHHAGRDDYRPGRNHSPRRNDHHAREEGSGRSRGRESGRGGRGRSRSPEYGRKDRDSYRRRSPSPYGRPRPEAELDLPRRYGADVPDVQIILQPEVSRDFVTWVETAFKAKGLKTEVMYLHPRFPKDQVIQRQAAEGVYGVIDLDLRAQSMGRIPVQAFDRSGGGSNIRFDQYVDLDPGTAAEVIVRAKATAAANYGQGYAAAAAGGYPSPYPGQHQHPPHNAGYPASYPPQQQQQQQASPATADIASLIGHVDNATLQRLLASMQGPSHAQGAVPAVQSGYAVSPPAPAAAGSHVEIQAILGSLGGPSPSQQPSHYQGQYGSAYNTQPSATPNGGPHASPAGGDAAAQVQNIMAQLARYRQ